MSPLLPKDITNIPDARDRKKPMLREPLAVLQPARPAPVVPEVLPTPMDICNTEAILDAHDKAGRASKRVHSQLFNPIEGLKGWWLMALPS